MKNVRIGVVGIMGAGKSTLVQKLTEAPYDARLLAAAGYRNGSGVYGSPEDVHEKLLRNFYENPKDHAFKLQIWFLTSHFERERVLAGKRGIAIIDRVMAGDYIFAATQRDLERMSEDEFALYQTVYNTFKPKIPSPDILVYLDATTDTLLERIGQRGRTGENSIKPEYLDALRSHYERFISDPPCPVVHVDANQEATTAYFDEIAARLTDTLEQLRTA